MFDLPQKKGFIDWPLKPWQSRNKTPTLGRASWDPSTSSKPEGTGTKGLKNFPSSWWPSNDGTIYIPITQMTHILEDLTHKMVQVNPQKKWSIVGFIIYTVIREETTQPDPKSSGPPMFLTSKHWGFLGKIGEL